MREFIPGREVDRVKMIVGLYLARSLGMREWRNEGIREREQINKIKLDRSSSKPGENVMGWVNIYNLDDNPSQWTVTVYNSSTDLYG